MVGYLRRSASLKNRGHLVHGVPLGPIRCRPSVRVLDRRIRAVFEQQPGDVHGLGFIVGRQIHEQRLAVVAAGALRFFGEELAQPIDMAGVADFPGAAAVPGEQGDHPSGLAVPRAAEGRVVVLAADRIDLGAARDQELADVDGIMIRRDVERTLARGAFDVWRHAQIEQQLHRLSPVVPGRGEERVVRLQELRVSGDLVADCGLVAAQARGDEPLHRVQRHRGARSPVADEQFRDALVPADHGLVVERALAIAPLRPWCRVRIGAMRQAPLGQLHVVVLDGDVQEPPRAGSITAGVEHLPFRIGPVRRSARAERVLVNQFEKPQDLAVEVDVVDDLLVVRVGASFKKEPHERVSLLMRAPALLTLADRAGERRVVAVAGHEIRVGVRAMVQEGTCDRHGVFSHRRQRQAGEAYVGERLPALRAPVSPGQIPFASAAGSIRGGLAVPPGRPAWVGRESAMHRVEIAADDSRVEVRGRECRVASQQAHRRVLGTDVIGSAAHVVIGAGVVQEERHRLVQRPGHLQ